MTSPGLRATTVPLCRTFDVALLDLDGVVYVGRSPVEGVAESLAAVRAQGMRLAFVTNNAARPPDAVAERLRGMAVPAETGEVVTSAQAAAHYLADRLPHGASVLVVGTRGLHEALLDRGLRPVTSAADDPQAVVQGFSDTLSWGQLAEGAVAIRRGLPWIATNLDPTVPSERGPLPGNGSMVAALRQATGATPTVTGKPDPTMHRESVQRSNARHPLVVGDRLDTDIAGAAAVGCPSLLVLSGVTGPGDLVNAPAGMRPDFLAGDVSGLLQVHPAPALECGKGVRARLGAWAAQLADGGRILLCRDGDDPGDGEGQGETGDHGGGLPGQRGSGSAGDGLDCLRVLCAVAWTAAGDPPDGGWRCSAAGTAAADALARLGFG